MNKLSARLAALLIAMPVFTTVTSAQADVDQFTGQQGAPLMKGLSGPDQLADLIEASLAKDSSGNSLLDEKRCNLNGSCATPRIYMVAINTWHPKSAVTLSGLAKYIRGLKNARAEGEFLSARMVGRQLDLNSGWARKLMPGEDAWYDTQTNEVILLENCGNVAKLLPTNVAEVPVVANESCKLVNAYTGADDTIHPMILVKEGEGFRDPHHCLAYKLAGQSAFTPGLPICAKMVCHYDDIENSTGLKVAIYNNTPLFGTANHLIEGDQVIRVPAGYAVAICYDPADGSKYLTQTFLDNSYYRKGEATVMRTAADNPDVTWRVFWHPVQ